MRQDYLMYVNSHRDSAKTVKFYIHNKCESTSLYDIFCSMPYINENEYADGLARVVACNDNTVAYRIDNVVFIIPATIKGVINNGTSRIDCYFDYPCEMKVEDLVEY